MSERSNFDKLRDASLITEELHKEEYKDALNALDPKIVDELISAASQEIDDDGGAEFT